MTIVRQEFRQGRTALVIWTGAVAFLLAVCVMMFPEMKGEMDLVGSLFASLGSFTAAFGMDRVNFGTLTGFYAVECGSVLGLGGAFFASLAGISALSAEEKGKTAEFLLTHPVSRRRVVTEKLVAVAIRILIMNLVLLAVALLSVAMIGEPVPRRELLLMHAAYLLMQAELAAVCFGISAFLRRGGAGIGIGLATAAYFLNLIANMSEKVKFLKYITPFGYCEGADIIAGGRLDGVMAGIGLAFAAAGVVAAYVRYCGKDIR